MINLAQTRSSPCVNQADGRAVNGTVVDENGNPVETVSVSLGGTLQRLEGRTNIDGHFEITFEAAAK